MGRVYKDLDEVRDGRRILLKQRQEFGQLVEEGVAVWLGYSFYSMSESVQVVM